MQGKFIVLEGFEGAGKSTLREVLMQELPPETTVFTREPGGTLLSEELREILKHGENGKKASDTTRLLMFWAARSDHMHHVILPALQAGMNVICDRFDASTFAYQVWGPQALHLEKMFVQLRDEICCPEPSQYIFLDVDWYTGLMRSRAAQELDNFASVSVTENTYREEGYRQFFKKYAAGRHVVVDARREHWVVQQDAKQAVLEALS